MRVTSSRAFCRAYGRRSDGAGLFAVVMALIAALARVAHVTSHKAA